VFNREGGSIPVVSTFQEELGVPSVLFGVGLPDENAHAPDEKLDLGNFHNGIIASAFLYDEIAQLQEPGRGRPFLDRPRGGSEDPLLLLPAAAVAAAAVLPVLVPAVVTPVVVTALHHDHTVAIHRPPVVDGAIGRTVHGPVVHGFVDGVVHRRSVDRRRVHRRVVHRAADGHMRSKVATVDPDAHMCLRGSRRGRHRQHRGEPERPSKKATHL
jgi:hypothetical protein